MVLAAEVGPKDTILEIGPGKGILTEELLKTGAKVIAVEKDIKLFNILTSKFRVFIDAGRLVLLNADIRDIVRFRTRFGVRIRTEFGIGINKVVANIPYYLTGQLLRLILPQVSRGLLKTKLLVIMLQKEVAKRICSSLNPNSVRVRTEFGFKMNLLAISVQVFVKPKIAFLVKKGNFWPQPKVDSAVVIFKKRGVDFFRQHKIGQKAFFKLVKTGFRHPRKLLKNNLKNFKFQVSSFKKCKIAKNARAEELSLKNWACLTKRTDIHSRK